MSAIAWHFLTERGKLRDESPAADPKGIERFAGELRICKAGLHASISALDAVGFAPGAIVRRVECVGDMLREPDKLVCTERRVLWTADAAETLHDFACWCAERALDREEAAGRTVDPRSRNAIAVKRAWLHGEATDAELTAASAAARAAARAADSAAARAADSAADRDAARAAARAADSAADRDAERAVQSAELERRLLALEPRS